MYYIDKQGETIIFKYFWISKNVILIYLHYGIIKSKYQFLYQNKYNLILWVSKIIIMKI